MSTDMTGYFVSREGWVIGSLCASVPFQIVNQVCKYGYELPAVPLS